MKVYKTFLFLLINFFYLSAYSQSSDTTVKFITSYLRIPFYPTKWRSVNGFYIKNIDKNDSISWRSPLEKNVFKMDSTFLLKVDLPLNVVSSSKEMWCTFSGESSAGEPILKEYGGLTLSNIQLLLKSKPKGANVFLIPNRIWNTEIEGKNWQNNQADLERFRVNTSTTDTFALIDQTVYVILFNSNGKWLKRIHFTKPEKIQKQQVVSVEF
ncbi:MAG: hypothetical protein JWQ25_732 [Daejeonella sp.]|nr:hypothetical protein [Daejeonella sp.]